jgi:hypothetical protein
VPFIGPSSPSAAEVGSGLLEFRRDGEICRANHPDESVAFPARRVVWDEGRGGTQSQSDNQEQDDIGGTGEEEY